MIPAAAPQPKPAHKLLRGIIRGTGGFIAFFSALELPFILFVMVFAVRHSTWPQVWLGGPFLLLVAALFLVFLLAGYRMWRRIDAVTVANFAFIFSYLLAKVFYHLLPESFPRIVVEYFGRSHLSTELGKDHFVNTLLSVIFFFICYVLIKAQLLRILELDGTSRPHNPGSSDPDAGVSDPTIPEFPQKSPLVVLE